MNRHAKAPSAGSSTRQGSRLGAVVRGAFATRGASRDANGSGAPRAKLALGALAALAFVLVLAVALAGAAIPAVTLVEPANSVEYTTAHLEGEVNPEDHETSYRFEYITEDQYLANIGGGEPSYTGASETATESLPENGGLTPVAADLTGLAPETAYYFRLVAANESGSNFAPSGAPFHTKGPVTAPVVSIPTVSEVAYTTAKASGEVTAGDADPGFNSPCHFDYVTDDHFNAEGFENPNQASCDVEPTGSAATPVSADLSGLTPAGTYHLRLVATNLAGTSSEPAASTFTTEPVAKPTPTVEAVTVFTDSTATFVGHVNPNAPEAEGSTSPAEQAAFETSWHFECVAPGPSCGELSGAPVPAGNAAVEVKADVIGLEPNSPYYVKLIASNAGGTEEAATAASPSFTTLSVKPTISAATLVHPTLNATSIQLKALVNPHNATLTDCHFVYGIGAASGNEAPCDSLPGGNEAVFVSAGISGLTPGAEYRFKLLATNAAGSEEGDVRAFTTFAVPTTEGTCPNEAIRIAQHATQLGDCRAFEKVSPAEKGDGDIVGEGESTVSSKAGDGVVFESQMVFGDAVGSGNVGRTTYLARRASGGGWATHAITPRHRPDALQVLAASTKFGVFSEDLSTALVWAYDLPGVTDDTPNRENLYAEDTATGALRPVSVSQVKPLVLQDFLDPNIWGVSEDAKHIAFATTTQMLPDAAGKKSNAYQWDDGTLSVAGVLPDGSVPAGGTDIKPKNVRSTMSADGSRLAFTSAIDSQLYLRIDGGRTVWISQPEGSDTSTPTGIAFQGMTPDGKNVFFVSDSPLLDSDTSPGSNLYRWTDSPDPANDGNLTLITSDNSAQNDPGGFGSALVGMSDDGSKVYIHGGDATLRVWTGGPPTPRVIDPSVARSSQPRSQLTVLASQPGYGRVSADGNWLAYINVDNNQLYVYSLRDDSDTCVSCPSDASLTPTVTGSSRVDFTALRPRWLTDDGKVFFTSTGALVPQDTNGVADTYEYDGPTGKLSLLSTGKGSEPAMFADASASGDDVFILTRQQLVPSDTDEYVDVYDVRVNGGVEESESVARPCSGEACQPNGAASPTGPSISSAALGRGNQHPRCAKNQHKVRRKGKVRCVKRDHTRHAKHNRKASR